MKIGIFTDSHYSSDEITCGNRKNNLSLDKIKEAYRFFEEQGCELAVCLGDLVDHEKTHQEEIENLKQAADVIRSSPLPTLCLMGNHDAFIFTREEFYRILGLPEPSEIILNGKHLFFLDACYFRDGTHYMPGDSDWENTFYPYTDELKTRLDGITGDAYIFIHQNLDPDISNDHRLHNADKINKILFDSQKVKTVYQGHYHPGNKSRHGGIDYVTFPAVCEYENAYFTEEI